MLKQTTSISYKLLIGKVLFYINMTYYNLFEKEIRNTTSFENILKINHEIDKSHSLQFNSFNFVDSTLKSCKTFENIEKEIEGLRYIDFILNKEVLLCELQYYYKYFK